MPAGNCFISLTTHFLRFIFLNFELLPPQNRCKVQKNVGKNRDERGWGQTFVCLGAAENTQLLLYPCTYSSNPLPSVQGKVVMTPV